jgi:protein TonB
VNVGAPPAPSLRRPIAVSAAVHLLIGAALLLGRASSSPATPPTYRVSLVAAPPGPRAVGTVQPAAPEPVAPPPPPTPAPATAPAAGAAAPTPAPARSVPTSSRMPSPPTRAKPKPVGPVATPSSAAAARPGTATAPAAVPAAPPRAGGGPTGGRGADVANVQVDGIAFPYPGYLENVVRQIALRFKPPTGGALTAVVAFLIRRDGSVTGIRLTTRSGVYSFDTEAMGAVDAAAQLRAFGPLPQGFTDDVLPVIFSFDPRLIR